MMCNDANHLELVVKQKLTENNNYHHLLLYVNNIYSF